MNKDKIFKLKLTCKGKGKDLIITHKEYVKQLNNPNFIKSFNVNKPNMVGVLVDEDAILHEIILEEK